MCQKSSLTSSKYYKNKSTEGRKSDFKVIFRYERGSRKSSPYTHTSSISINLVKILPSDIYKSSPPEPSRFPRFQTSRLKGKGQSETFKSWLVAKGITSRRLPWQHTTTVFSSEDTAIFAKDYRCFHN